jgi:hypothetical protein
MVVEEDVIAGRTTPHSGDNKQSENNGATTCHEPLSVAALDVFAGGRLGYSETGS